MVYESDFYTTRRTRPTYSSYTSTVPSPRYVIRRSVSPLPSYTTTYTIPRYTRAISPVLSTVTRLRSLPTFTVYTVPSYSVRRTPNLTYSRIVQVPVVSSHVGRNAPYIAEMDRIVHRMRPRVGYEACEDFLNSEAITTFDDETRAIRARTKELLRRVNEPIPRHYYPYEYSPKLMELEPINHEEYIENRVLTPMRHVHQDIQTMSRFTPEPSRQYIGKGNLACVQFAGGRSYDRRRALLRCEEERNVKDDIRMLSYYNRARSILGNDANLDVIKALLETRYHRTNPEPELMVIPYSRPRAPAPLILRIEERENMRRPYYNPRNEIMPYVPTPSKSKELARLRMIAERDAELGKKAYSEAQQAVQQARSRGEYNNQDDLDRIARKKQREMQLEEESRREAEARRAERDASKRQAEQDKQRELDNEERERQESLERKAEAERRAEAMKKEAERREEEERLAKEEEERAAAEAEERQAAEEAARLVKEEEEKQQAEKAKQEEEARLEAERQAAEAQKAADEEASKQAELKRQEEEKKAAELAAKKAEEERLEAERKAEEERLAAEKAEAERLEEERLAAEKAEAERLEAEKLAAEAAAEVQAEEAVEPPVEASEAPAEASEAPAESTEAPAVEEPSETPATEEQTSDEPVIEEPATPEVITNGTNENGTLNGGDAVEISLDGDNEETVVKKIQDIAPSEEIEA